jgi:hypothetical protein
MKCDECGQSTNSLWKATDDFGDEFRVCGECIESEKDLRLLLGDGR